MLKQFNEAMAYIETCLPGPVAAAATARVAGVSEYHFRRVFSFLAGMGFGEYLRRRRLALAGAALQEGRMRVLDAALTYGYETPEAFAKAFQAFHGVRPSAAGTAGVGLKAFPPLTFQLTMKGGQEMEYRFEELPAFQIVGFKKRITIQYQGVNHQLDSLSAQLTAERIRELKALNNLEPQGILSVSANFAERLGADTELDQYLGVATTKEGPAGYTVLPVAAAKWAVFTACGAFPTALQELWGRIYAEWLPGSGYELAPGPEMLWNESPDTTKPDYKSEIWIPVRGQSLQ